MCTRRYGIVDQNCDYVLRTRYPTKSLFPSILLDVQMDSLTSAAEVPIWKPEFLAPKEIRLLRIDLAESEAGLIQCTLQCFPLDTVPPYYALSYVWGHLSVQKNILINNGTFAVTENLHDALRQLPDRGDSWWWIDAICIDQSSLSEKSKHVPKMADIYSSAESVVCWLGREPLYDVELIKDVCDRIPERYTGQPQNQNLHDKLGVDLEKFLMACFQLCYNPWFHRLWTVQEYALSPRDVIALIGNDPCVKFTLSSLPAKLYDIRVNGNNVKESDSISFMIANSAVMRAITVEALAMEIRTEDWDSKSFAHQLLALFQATGQRWSSNPHDKIYGLLGIPDEEQIPPHLLPDYNKPFEQVYFDYTRYIIEHTGDLRILASTINSLEGVPTWVPDLRGCRFSAVAPETTNSAKFSSDGRTMTLQGVLIGKIILRCTGCHESMDVADQTTSLLNFEDTVLTGSAWLQQKSLPEVFREWLHAMCDSLQLSRDVVREINSMQDLLSYLPDRYWADGKKDEPGLLLPRIAERVANVDYGLLENGDVLTCAFHRSPGPDACVFAFKGSRLLSIVRPVNAAYEVVGACNSKGNAGIDEECYSKQKIELIDLV